MGDKKKCMIIGAAKGVDKNVFDEFNLEEYYIICADGGFETALDFGINPDYVVGDFDSVKQIPDTLKYNVKVLPKRKDVTDTMYAVLTALGNGMKHFVLVGCLGGDRADHTMANYNVMLYITRKGGNCVLVDNASKTFLLSDSRLRVTNQIGCTVSVFPFGTNMCNVSYDGLKYPLHKTDLMMGDTVMGVSNEIINYYAEVEVNAGYAMVIVYNEPFDYN